MRSLVRATLARGHLAFVATPETIWVLVGYLAPHLDHDTVWSARAVAVGATDNQVLREGP